MEDRAVQMVTKKFIPFLQLEDALMKRENLYLSETFSYR